MSFLSSLFGSADYKSSNTNSTQNQTSNQTQNSTQNVTGSQTTTLPDYLQAPTTSLYGLINSAVQQASTPGYAQSLVPGASAAQQAAYGSAAKLGGWSDYLGQSAYDAQRAADAQPSTSAGTAVGPTMATYNASVAPAQTYAPSLASTALASAAQIDPSKITALMNPYISSVVDTTNAQSDKLDAQQRAALSAQGALSNAFGGSRFGLAQSNLLGTQGLNRATTDAGLYSQGYNTALQYANLDADRSQQVGLANAAASNATSQFNANATNTAGQFNANAYNTAAAQQANLNQQANAATAAATNAATLQQASLDQANNQFNAQQNDAALARYLSAAGIMSGLSSQYGDQSRGDIATQLAAGQDQRSIAEEQNMSQLALAQFLANFLPNSNNLLGKDAVGTTNTNQTSSTNTTTNTKGNSSSFGISAGIGKGG